VQAGGRCRPPAALRVVCPVLTLKQTAARQFLTTTNRARSAGTKTAPNTGMGGIQEVTGGGGLQASLSLAELCAGAEPFAPAEAAAVLGPLLEKVASLHISGSIHGSLTMATVTVCVCGPAGDSVHLAPSASGTARCTRCIAPEDKLAGPGSQEGDVWSIGVIALQLLLGRQCDHAQRRGCCAGIVDRATGELPVLPRGLSFACVDFLTDCLEADPAQRPTAAALLQHPYIRAVSGSGAADAAHGELDDADVDMLMDGLIIADDVRSRPPPCRPRAVPSLTTPLWDLRVSFEAPSHTHRCTRCPGAFAHHVAGHHVAGCCVHNKQDRTTFPPAAAAACPAARRAPRRCPSKADAAGTREASPTSALPTKRRRCRSASLSLVAVSEDGAGQHKMGVKRSRRHSVTVQVPLSVDAVVVCQQLAGVVACGSYASLSSSPSPSPDQVPMTALEELKLLLPPLVL
jgi:hypothetical protein